MNLAWRVEVTETAARQLRGLDQSAQEQIVRYLKERLACDEDPRRFGAPLRRDLIGRWKYRVGSYRIICEIKDQAVLVLVLMVGHRSKVYGGH